MSDSKIGDVRASRDNGAPRPWSHIVYDLDQPIPKRLIEQKPASGGRNADMLDYVPWYRVQRMMNYYTNGFITYEVKMIQQIGDAMSVQVRVTIVSEEGEYFAEGTGWENINTKAYGDPQSNAESMAFRRACSRFGLGLALYEGNPDRVGRRTPPKGAASEKPEAPEHAQDNPPREEPVQDGATQDTAAPEQASYDVKPGSVRVSQLEEMRRFAKAKHITDDSEIVNGINEMVDGVERQIPALSALSESEAAIVLAQMRHKAQKQAA